MWKLGSKLSLSPSFFFLIRETFPLFRTHTVKFLLFLNCVYYMACGHPHVYLPPPLGKGIRLSPAAWERCRYPQAALTVRRAFLLTGSQHTLRTWFCCMYPPSCEWNLVPTTALYAESFPTGRRCSGLRSVGSHFWWLVLLWSLLPSVQWESSLGIGSCSLPA